MARPLFIDDGYTETTTIPADTKGRYPEFEVTFRPLVGEPAAQARFKIQSYEPKDPELESYYAELCAAQCLSIGGAANPTAEKVQQMHLSAILAIVVLLFDPPNLEADAKN